MYRHSHMTFQAQLYLELLSRLLGPRGGSPVKVFPIGPDDDQSRCCPCPDALASSSLELNGLYDFQAYKHIKAHPLEKHLEECLAEWKMYIKMMKAWLLRSRSAVWAA